MANETWPAHNIATAVVESMRRHKRKPADFYPTQAEATQGLLNTNPPPPGARLWECACGEGHISRVLEANGFLVASTDLRYTGYGMAGVDFLKTLPDLSTPIDGIVTNPPFSLAEAFIRHALDVLEVDYLALLLKANYFHTQGRVALKERYPPTGIHPVTWRIPFLKKERGNSPLMDCTWYVWEKGKPVVHDLIVKPTEFPDISEPGLKVLMARLGEEIDRLTSNKGKIKLRIAEFEDDL